MCTQGRSVMSAFQRLTSATLPVWTARIKISSFGILQRLHGPFPFRQRFFLQRNSPIQFGVCEAKFAFDICVRHCRNLDEYVFRRGSGSDYLRTSQNWISGQRDFDFLRHRQESQRLSIAVRFWPLPAESRQTICRCWTLHAPLFL